MSERTTVAWCNNCADDTLHTVYGSGTKSCDDCGKTSKPHAKTKFEVGEKVVNIDPDCLYTGKEFTIIDKFNYASEPNGKIVYLIQRDTTANGSMSCCKSEKEIRRA